MKIKQEKMLNFVDIVRRVRTCGQLIKEEDILLLLHGLLSESESVQLLLLQKTATKPSKHDCHIIEITK